MLDEGRNSFKMRKKGKLMNTNKLRSKNSVLWLVVVVLSVALVYTNRNSINSVENTSEEEIVFDQEAKIDPQPTAPINPVGIVKITASALNVRKTPNGQIVGALKKDEMCYIYGFSGNWLQVLYKGQYGFIYSKYADIYDFTNVKVSMDDIHAVFSVKEYLATKELSELDIQVLKTLEEVQKNTLTTALAVSNTNQPDSKTEPNVEVEPVKQVEADELAKQQALAIAKQQEAQELAIKQQQEAQELAIKQQQEALAQAEALAKQVAEQQAALLAEQQAQALKALEAQMAEEAKKQALLAKDPSTLNTTELCQYVLAQIITPDMDDFAKAIAVNNWLCDHMTYDLNYYRTRDALLIGRGRCQGYANAYKNLMNTAGIPTDYISGYGKGQSHGWNRVLINGAYYYVDVTWNDTSGNYSKYLLMSEADINRDHQPVRLNPRSE